MSEQELKKEIKRLNKLLTLKGREIKVLDRILKISSENLEYYFIENLNLKKQLKEKK